MMFVILRDACVGFTDKREYPVRPSMTKRNQVPDFLSKTIRFTIRYVLTKKSAAQKHTAERPSFGVINSSTDLKVTSIAIPKTWLTPGQ